MRVGLTIAVLLIPFGATAQSITPAERADAVRVGYSSCMRGQIARTPNAQAHIDILEKYCVCFANKMAARLSSQDLAEHEANKGLATEGLIAFAEGIGYECKAELGLQ